MACEIHLFFCHKTPFQKHTYRGIHKNSERFV
jgi:hypothetical protein